MKLTRVSNFSVKGCLAFGLNIVLFLTQVALAEDKLSLDIESFNSSTVDLACRYEGNKTDLFFNVYKESDACIFYKSTCQYYPHGNCKLHCIEETCGPNKISFSMNPPDDCQERVNVRFSARSLNDRQYLDLDTFFVLTAQSDPPEILIDDVKQVVSLIPVQIECRVTNRCDPTMLELTGAYMILHNLSHTKEGSRFTTLAKASVIFNKVGNYTISCREAGKEGSFSSSRIIEVQNPVGLSDEPTCRGEPFSGSIRIGFALSSTVFIICCAFQCVKKVHTKKKAKIGKCCHSMKEKNVSSLKDMEILEISDLISSQEKKSSLKKAETGPSEKMFYIGPNGHDDEDDSLDPGVSQVMLG